MYIFIFIYRNINMLYKNNVLFIQYYYLYLINNKNKLIYIYIYIIIHYHEIQKLIYYFYINN
jgi:hypothetical protein